MIGLLENERERAEVGKMTLEHAFNLWREGKLRTVLAVHAAKVCPCECGNSNGFDCFQSNHRAMRQSMQFGLKADEETVHVGIISQG